MCWKYCIRVYCAANGDISAVEWSRKGTER